VDSKAECHQLNLAHNIAIDVTVPFSLFFCLSVCLSVCHFSALCSNSRIDTISFADRVKIYLTYTVGLGQQLFSPQIIAENPLFGIIAVRRCILHLCFVRSDYVTVGLCVFLLIPGSGRYVG